MRRMRRVHDCNFAFASFRPFCLLRSGAAATAHSTFFIKRGAWLQHRARTFCTLDYVRHDWPQFMTCWLPFPRRTIRRHFRRDFIAWQVMALAAYQFNKIRKNKLNPLKTAYVDTSVYKKVVEENIWTLCAMRHNQIIIERKELRLV
ncbi:MAG: DUF5692 family protein [Slackia sp.]